MNLKSTVLLIAQQVTDSRGEGASFDDDHSLVYANGV
jgi:hypothetical protein